MSNQHARMDITMALEGRGGVEEHWSFWAWIGSFQPKVRNQEKGFSLSQESPGPSRSHPIVSRQCMRHDSYNLIIHLPNKVHSGDGRIRAGTPFRQFLYYH